MSMPVHQKASKGTPGTTSCAKAIDPIAFVTCWNRAATIDVVAKRFVITKRAATHKAMFYRRRGVELKRFFEAGPRVDWDAIKKAARAAMRRG